MQRTEEDMVQYDKFFKDYEKIEKFGLRAGVDSLKNQQDKTMQQNKPVELPPEVKKIYNDMGNYTKKMNFVE